MRLVKFVGGSSLLLLFLLLCSLDSLSIVSSVDSLLSQLLVDSSVLHLGGKSLDLASLHNLWECDDTLLSALSGCLQLVGSGVVDLSLLELTFSSWEQDKLVLVLGKSSNVLGHGVGVLVVSSVVNSDTNSSGESWGKVDLRQFLERESSSELNLMAVSSGLSEDGWSKLGDWSDSGGGSLGSSSLGSKLFVSWLVEEALNSSHPVLSQMRTLKDIIVFCHVAY